MLYNYIKNDKYFIKLPHQKKKLEVPSKPELATSLSPDHPFYNEVSEAEVLLCSLEKLMSKAI